MLILLCYTIIACVCGWFIYNCKIDIKDLHKNIKAKKQIEKRRNIEQQN